MSRFLYMISLQEPLSVPKNNSDFTWDVIGNTLEVIVLIHEANAESMIKNKSQLQGIASFKKVSRPL